MKISVLNTEKELVEVAFKFLFRNWLFWAMMFALFFFIIVFITALLSGYGISWIMIFFMMVCLYLPLATYMNTKRGYIKENRTDATIYTFLEDKIVVSYLENTVEMPWNEVFRVEEWEKFIIIKSDKHNVSILPKRCFSAPQLNEFLNLVSNYKIF